MRRLAVTVVFATSFLFALPSPAHAWWHWLDELTGPGPFTGPDLQWRLLCFDDPLPETAQPDLIAKREKARQFLNKREADLEKAEFSKLNDNQKERDAVDAARIAFATAQDNLKKAVDDTRKSQDPGDYVLRSLKSFESGKHPRFKREFARFSGVACATGESKNPAASLNLRTALLWSIDNHLDYGSKAAPRIFLWQPELSFSAFVDHRKSVELMTGAGLSRFSGEGFDSFWRFYWKPIGLTFSPAALVRRDQSGNLKNCLCDRLIRAFTISSAVLYIPKGFTAADFGATGTFKTDRELVGTVAIVFDLSRF